MTNFMDRFMGRKPAPAQQAKDRLKLVLVTDRTTISPEDLRKMQNEILDVIRKYCRVSEDDVHLKFEQRERDNYLVADIPLKATRTDEEGGSVRIETSLVSNTTPPTDNEKPEEEAKQEPAAKAEEKTAEPETKKEEEKKDEDEEKKEAEADAPKVSGAPAGLSATTEEKKDDLK